RMSRARPLPPFPTRRSSDLLDDSVLDLVAHSEPVPAADPIALDEQLEQRAEARAVDGHGDPRRELDRDLLGDDVDARLPVRDSRSEEHTSELQSREKLVCRL